MNEPLNATRESLYFQQKEQELIEQIRRRRQSQHAQQTLAAVVGVTDEEILATLLALGYTRETVRLLYLVPLVQVAWASGSVTARERELVLQAAELSGVMQNSRHCQQLIHWLDERPAEEFFAQTLRVIADITELLPTDKRAAGRNSLLVFCANIAEASGGILGFGNKVSAGEQQVLDQITAELNLRNPAAVQRFVASIEEPA